MTTYEVFVKNCVQLNLGQVHLLGALSKRPEDAPVPAVFGGLPSVLGLWTLKAQPSSSGLDTQCHVIVCLRNLSVYSLDGFFVVG